MPKGPWDPKGGFIGKLLTLRPVEVQTRVRGKHIVFISEEVGFRTLTRGCADYEREFTTFTQFAQGPAKMVEAEEEGEPNPAQYLDCPDPFATLTPKPKTVPEPDYGIEGYDPNPPAPEPPLDTPFGDQSFIP